MAGQGTPFALPESVWVGVIDLYVNYGWGAEFIGLAVKYIERHKK